MGASASHVATQRASLRRPDRVKQGWDGCQARRGSSQGLEAVVRHTSPSHACRPRLLRYHRQGKIGYLQSVRCTTSELCSSGGSEAQCTSCPTVCTKTPKEGWWQSLIWAVAQWMKGIGEFGVMCEKYCPTKLSLGSALLFIQKLTRFLENSIWYFSPVFTATSCTHDRQGLSRTACSLTGWTPGLLFENTKIKIVLYNMGVLNHKKVGVVTFYYLEHLLSPVQPNTLYIVS